MTIEELITIIQNADGLTVGGIITAILTTWKLIKMIFAKITGTKAKTDARDIANTKKAIQELTEERKQ